MNEKTDAIKGILFDKDGTLIDYDLSWAPVNRALALAAARGDAVLADRLLSACGMDPVSGHVTPDSLLAAGTAADIAKGLIEAGSTVPLAALTRELDDIFAASVEMSVPVTDLSALFSRLKAKGLKLGIASSDNERSIRALVQRFGLDDHVDFIAGYDSGHGSKPEPGMIIGFCAATGLAPTEVAMVGDNNHDLIMARNAGAGLAIGVLTGTGTKESLGRFSDHCLMSISQLDEMFV
ncbi:HAD family hydrolase [Allorhizobium sp. BGMRC 0089]|uniref:HAD family hydrolase n=1 Tax=Allorhizobium sonneratiae TaxID=2934936 RepID=UPI002033DC4B|nr:HAD family hydrolase [Allorhizobium sonneratiae]MCM2291317.1 HAD family hydrolase [Allorhizobium sonneratiae]